MGEGAIAHRQPVFRHVVHERAQDEAFFNATTNYFKENAYSSVVSRDLWKHFEEPARKSGLMAAVNMTMQNMMELWVNNSGFPEVSVIRDYKTNTVTVFQYKLQWEWPDKEDKAMLWPIWLPFYTPMAEDNQLPTGSFGKFLPASRTQKFQLPNDLSQKSPVVFNKGAESYIRVRYDSQSLCKLAKLLRENHTRMSTVERAQLHRDLAPLAMPNPKCKPCGIAGWVHMMEYLKMERDYIPLITALDQLQRVKGMLEGTSMEARFARWMHSLIQPFFDERGYTIGKDETEDQKLLKRHMVTYACLRSGDKSACVTEAFAQVKRWIQSESKGNPISPYLREAFYKAVIEGSVVKGNSDIVEFLLRKYEEAKKMRFRHLENFQQLLRAYIHYENALDYLRPPTTKVILNETATETRSETETKTKFLEDKTCSMVETSKIRIENPDLGIQVLKKCWYKLKKSEGLSGKLKELLGKVASKRQIEELMKWSEEENFGEMEGVTENKDVTEKIKHLTAKARARLQCADMVAGTLAKVL